jgi:hypothetical protein
MHYHPKPKPIGILPPKMRYIQKPMPMQQSKFHPDDDLTYRGVQQQQFPRNNNPFTMGPGDMTMSTTMPTEVINQMMICSYQQQQQRFLPTWKL